MVTRIYNIVPSVIVLKSIFTAFIILFVFFQPKLSYSQLPLLTDNTGTLDKGKSQIELSNGVGYHSQHRCHQTISEISGVYSLGISEKTDILLGIPFLNVSSVNDSALTEAAGFSDLNIELKYRILTIENFSLAVKPGISAPTGDNESGLGAGKFSGSFFLISTYYNGSFSFNYNIGYLQNNNRCGAAMNLWHTSLSADYSAGENLHLVLNSGLEKSSDILDKTPPAFGLVGFYYLINEKFEVGAGYKTGLTSSETKHSFVLSITCRFP